jgi:hypothetical protein
MTLQKLALWAMLLFVHSSLSSNTLFENTLATITDDVSTAQPMVCADCPDNCILLTMTDEFGDGWNDATYRITNSATNEILASGTLAGGSSGNEEICMPAWGCFTITVGGGSFDSEIGWIVTAIDEGIVSGGAPEVGYFSLGGSTCPGCQEEEYCNYNPSATLGDYLDYCCFDQCFMIEMFDDFGDGWNGALFQIVSLNTGWTVEEGTLADGTEGLAHLCLGDGCYFIRISGGAFASEVSWSLAGTDQGTITGGNPDEIYFTIGSPTCDGCTDISACNYNPLATVDDGSCCAENCVELQLDHPLGPDFGSGHFYIIDTNTNQLAESITLRSGIFSICLPDGCYMLKTTGTFYSVDWLLTGIDQISLSGSTPEEAYFSVGGASCSGCTNPAACNYNEVASGDDGSCCFNNCLLMFMDDYVEDGIENAQYNIVNQTTGFVAASGSLSTPEEGVDFICLPDGCYELEIMENSPFYTSNNLTLFDTDDGNLNHVGSAPDLHYFSVGNPICSGCTDSSAFNYNEAADINDGSCCYNAPAYLQMNDSFGDGWNGGTYSIVDIYSQIEVASGTMPQSAGFSAVDFVCIPPGCYSITVDGSTFYTEITWGLHLPWVDPVFGISPDTQYFSTDGVTCTGCIDPTACNFLAGATVDDGSCVYPGCTDFNACNYDASSGCDDGSCTYPGCTDSGACNYDASAGCDNGICVYESNCVGDCVNAFGHGVDFIGNYAANAAIWNYVIGAGDGEFVHTTGSLQIIGGDNGVLSNTQATTEVSVSGTFSFDWSYWTEDGGSQYDPAYYINGTPYTLTLVDGTLSEVGTVSFDADVGDQIGFGVHTTDGILGAGHLMITNFTYPAENCGCNDPLACNYDITVTIPDNATCTYPGCADPGACNYDPLAGCGFACVYTQDECTGECLDHIEDAVDFLGYYASENWTDDIGAGNGSVEHFIGCVLIHGTDGIPGLNATLTTITAGADGTFSFDWHYFTEDEAPSFDAAFYINGTAVYITQGDGAFEQSGSVSFEANEGDVIGFGIDTADGQFGAAHLLVSNFRHPAQECPCAGDFSDDGLISTADLLILLAEMGCVVDCVSDLDGNGTVTTSDLLAFLALFGNACE